MKRIMLLSMAGITAAVMTTAGCGGGGSKEAAVEAAIVPGADFYATVDYADAAATPISKELEKIKEEKAASDEKSRAAVEKQKKLEEITGLGKGDLKRIMFSGDLDGVDFESEDKKAAMEAFNAVVGVQLAKALPHAKLKEAVDFLAAEKPGATVTETEAAGRPALAIDTPEPDDPTIYVAGAEGDKVIFASINTTSLAAAIERSAGKTEAIPAAFGAVEKGLPDGSQARLLFLAPDSLRQKIQEKIQEVEKDSQQNPGNAMMLSFIKPFAGIKSVAFGTRLDTDISVHLAGDLGGEQEAMQVATLIQSMVLPMLKASLAQGNPEAAQGLDDRITAGSEGTTLQLSLQLTSEDLQNLNSMKRQ